MSIWSLPRPKKPEFRNPKKIIEKKNPLLTDIWYSIFKNHFLAQHFDKMLEFRFNFKINEINIKYYWCKILIFILK
jgi:hypothetical protein